MITPRVPFTRVGAPEGGKHAGGGLSGFEIVHKKPVCPLLKGEMDTLALARTQSPNAARRRTLQRLDAETPGIVFGMQQSCVRSPDGMPLANRFLVHGTRCKDSGI